MTKVIVRTPSFSRYRRIFSQSKGKSILRCLEYERLSSLNLSGRILDFGGGSKSNYSKEMMNWIDKKQKFIFESANIDPKTEPTYLIDQSESIPVESNYYDAVISLNTFEHIFNLHSFLNEIYRALKSSGRFIFIVPFIFRVHGHPDDFIRGTPSFWEKTLSEIKFKDVEIEAINWGPFSTALTVSGSPGPFKTIRRHVALLLDVFFFARKNGQNVKLQVQQDASICNAPIGYLIESKKS